MYPGGEKNGKVVVLGKYYIKIFETEGNRIEAQIYDDGIESLAMSSTTEKILSKSDDEILEAIKEKVRIFDKIHSSTTRNDLIKDIMFDVLMLLVKLSIKYKLDEVIEIDITDELLGKSSKKSNNG